MNCRAGQPGNSRTWPLMSGNSEMRRSAAASSRSSRARWTALRQCDSTILASRRSTDGVNRMIISERFVAARIPSHRPPPGELRRSPPRFALASPPRLGELAAAAAAHPKGAARFGPASRADDWATAFWWLATSFAQPTTALTAARTWTQRQRTASPGATKREKGGMPIAGPFELAAIMMACGGIWIPALVASGYQRWWHSGSVHPRAPLAAADTHGTPTLVPTLTSRLASTRRSPGSALAGSSR